MSIAISEDFIHYIWKVKNFSFLNLETTAGETLELLSFGTSNPNAGPDFLNASIKLSNTVWRGHIEMHVESSEWYKHKHENDPAYKNVILHVVFNHDKTVLIGKQPVPTLELKPRIKSSVYNAYHILRNNPKWIPCASWLSSVNDITISSTLDKILAERLTIKSNRILSELSINNNDWQEIIYQRLLWSFGLSVNADSFLKLSKLIPHKIIQKHKDSIEITESLLYGTAGFLDHEGNGDYLKNLKNHFHFYQKKYGISNMRPVEWKFMRMRPSGFPTIRIAQLAKFLISNSRLDQLIFSDDHKSLIDRFEISIDSGFWYRHYKFDAESKPIKKSIGVHKVHSILINTIAPLKYAYGVYHKNENFKNSAIELLESIPSESNAILKKWEQLGLKSQNAASSQSLLHLKKNHCSNKKCFTCPIGHQVFKQIERG